MERAQSGTFGILSSTRGRYSYGESEGPRVRALLCTVAFHGQSSEPSSVRETAHIISAYLELPIFCHSAEELLVGAICIGKFRAISTIVSLSSGILSPQARPSS